MRFAFNRRVTSENTVWVEAETEIEAWAHLLDEGHPLVAQSGDERIARKPVFRRLAELDEFDL